MGQILVLKNADFSDHAVDLENVYDVVKETCPPTVSTLMGNTGDSSRRMNTLAFDKAVKIIAVSFTFPADITSLLDKTTSINVGTCTYTTETIEGIVHYTITANAAKAADVTSIIRKAIANVPGYEGGTTHTVRLSTPLEVDAGECIYLSTSGQAFYCYSRANDDSHGQMVPFSSGIVTNVNYNFANTFYGIEIAAEE